MFFDIKCLAVKSLVEQSIVDAFVVAKKKKASEYANAMYACF